MKVVLDTNIIFNDPHLQGAKLRQLHEAVKTVGGTIYLPQVVVDETQNHYREHLERSKAEINKAVCDLNRLADAGIVDTRISQEAIDELLNDYKKEFASKVRWLDVEIIPYPDISHKDVVARDLKRCKPFQEKGTGYRDTLIWESILTICEKPEDLTDESKVIFITENRLDFCHRKKDNIFELHPDLQADLEGRHLLKNYVDVALTADECIDKHFRPALEVLNEIMQALNRDKSYGDLNFEDEIEERLIEYLTHRSIDSDESPFRPEFEDPSVNSVGEPDFVVTDVRKLSEDEVVIDLSIEVECEFMFYVFKSDLMIIDDDYAPFVLNTDWNKHYALASDSALLNLKMTLIVNSAFTQVLSDEIEII